MAILFTLRVFAKNLLRKNRRRNNFCILFDIWPGARTLALRLINQHTTYWTMATCNKLFIVYFVYVRP